METSRPCSLSPLAPVAHLGCRRSRRSRISPCSLSSLSAFRAAAINFVAITAAGFLCRRPVAVPRSLEAFGVAHHLLPLAPIQLISWLRSACHLSACVDTL